MPAIISFVSPTRNNQYCAYNAITRVHVESDIVEPCGVRDLEEVSGGGSKWDFGEDLCPLGVQVCSGEGAVCIDNALVRIPLHW